MFTYDNEWTESDWRHEADARELAELDADRRDMQEYPAPPLQLELKITPCCDNPANYKLSPSYDHDPEVGYWGSSYYRCICGNLIAEEDYAALVQLTELESRPRQRRHAA